MTSDYFTNLDDFYKGLQSLFKSLNVPVNYIDEKSLKPQDILSKTYKETNPSYQLMDDVYILGMVDDAAFDEKESDDISEIKKLEKDYDGILIFGITLKKRENGLLPTRTQLAEITRAFNREFHYTPVVVVFRYENFISLANAERLKYKQDWREGEKAGRVSVLRDVDIANPHTGHLKILEELKITRSGKKGINSFDSLYQYWQEVFSVSLLSKKFYSELSNWYFWAIKHVTFPSESNYVDEKNQEYKAQNVIRLLTRLLFVWFIKEKKLIPEELFDLDALQNSILKKIEPEHFLGQKQENQESIYYKAILQNLFFATLNCPIKPDSVDSRERGFRGDESYGKHRGVDYLMRYKKHFKAPDVFLEMVNEVVPFLNGGLFECLDDKENKIYIDGFSDNMTKGSTLIVPDYLFFGREERTDLSSDYGVTSKGTKEAAVKGLINILKSYKFTITENTPIEEDVALDPELLGKVFENLLASYNPETKTTARKQTGSFYTPREIVNYMVDESLIAHLKNAVASWDMEEKELDDQLHQLVSFDEFNPFENNCKLSKDIIHSLDSCKILDPACGSGAFPMGILQKMVHILQKVDPDNRHWQDLQQEKAIKETEGVFVIKDKKEREQLLLEISEAFDETINNPDYARKLFLIENCIYGVDIQPIATQISKLRFFISLVVEQKVNTEKENFGIRPLPNLETRFVTANTLIGIEKPKAQMSLFDTEAVKALEQELKTIRHKLFGAKTKATKVKYRKRDEELRNEIAEELKKSGWGNKSAEQLASWDPYDQNGSSPFFDPEWMFDIKDGFDVVIGNPPYINANELKKRLGKIDYEMLKFGFVSAKGAIDIYILFFEIGLKSLSSNGHLIYITPNRYLSASYGEALREFIFHDFAVKVVSDFSSVKVFEAASTYPIVSLIGRMLHEDNAITVRKFNGKFEMESSWRNRWEDLELLPGKIWGFLLNSKIEIVKRIISQSKPLASCGIINATSTAKEADAYHELINEEKGIKLINTGTIDRFLPLWGIERLTNKGDTYITPFLDDDESTLSPNRRNLYLSPKIILAKIALRTEAFYDEYGDYASINTNCIHSFNPVFHPKYVTLWVNSLLYQFVFSCFFDGLRMAGGYLLYSSPNLKSTFIKKPDKYFTDIFCLLHDLISWSIHNKESKLFDSIIDALFFELYFPDHMKERKIDVLQFVEKDIEEVMQGKEFETLSDTQKEQVIAELHKRWSDQSSEIFKRINSFSEKSPEILKPIFES